MLKRLEFVLTHSRSQNHSYPSTNMYSWNPTLSLSPCSTMSSHKIQSPSSRFILQIFSAVSMIWNSVSCKCIHSNHQTLSACWYYSPLQTNKTKNQSKPTHKRMNAFHKSECNYDSSTYSPHNPKFDRK